ncbi:SRPBCC family protein [Paenibacillus pasadenensis]|nr:SRPBCC domain-containing protein [Paenibacillus pasadenensis]
MSRRTVGQTASAGYQIGVRRTLPAGSERIWSFLTSPAGLKLWLGEVPPLALQAGEAFTARNGLSGEFRVVKLGEQLRLRWQKPDWPAPSTLQIRLLPAGEGRTTVSFHQEKLDHAGTREAMKQVWENVLDEMKKELTKDE